MEKHVLVTLEYFPQIGGVATYYKDIVEEFPANSIIVIAPEMPNTEAFDQAQSYTIIRSKTLAQLKTNHKKLPGIKKANSLKLQVKLLKELEVILKNHDIKHILVGHVLPLGTIVQSLASKHKINFSVFTHGYDILLPQAYKAKKLLLIKILKSAEKIVCNSEFTKKEIVKLGIDSKKINVIYPAIEASSIGQEQLETIKSKLVETYNIKNKKILLSVGRIVERKGFDQVIRALPRILYNLPDTHYVIVGDGPFKTSLQKLIKQKKAENHVTFANTASGAELAAWYEIADVFTMPSRQIGPDVEGFGIVYLEANKAGKPVIGGNSGGVPEAILDEETGVIVHPTDTAALTAACIRLLSDSQYANRLGTQGMQRVIEVFSKENLHEKIKKVFT